MHIATLVAKEISHNGTVALLTFKTMVSIPFQEGQFMMITCTLPDGTIKKRPYSIASVSADMDRKHISFLVKAIGE